MPVWVSIISDWKNHDYYLALLKAGIVNLVPDVRFFDITHDIPLYNIQRAGFVLRAVYNSLPKASIHLVCVNTEQNSDDPYVVIHHKGHYFIGADNGVFGIVFGTKPETIIRYYPENDSVSGFRALSVFTRLTAYIAEQGDINLIGERQTDVLRKTELEPAVEPGLITGHILYIDSYNNGITNISRELFNRHVGNQKFVIYINSHFYYVNKIYESYHEVACGDLVLLFNSLDLLEIAIREDDATALLSLDKKTLITIKY